MSNSQVEQASEIEKPGMQLVALRANQIAGPKGILPIGLTTWWEGVKTGKFPQPIRFSSRCTVWKREDIMALLENGLIQERH